MEALLSAYCGTSWELNHGDVAGADPIPQRSVKEIVGASAAVAAD
jgi:hypothetical protein